MAIRLGEYVVYGELYNTKGYATHGLIALRGKAPGEETVVSLDLTGNCDPDLQGKGFRFWPAEEDAEGPVFRPREHGRFHPLQVGPTGTMTAQGWVRVMPCGVEEFMRRAKLGEPPPTEWKRRLYLEWYSQNGRVVIEMANPVIEECVRPGSGEDDPGEWKPLPNLAPIPDLEEMKRTRGLEFTIFRQDEDKVEIERWRPVRPEEPDDEDTDDDEDSSYDDLQRYLDAEADAIDRAISGEDEDDPLAEAALMDYCVEHCEAKPMGSFLDNVDQLPRPETLDDDELEGVFKGVLAQMAMFGLAFHVCEHYTPRMAYQLLIDRVLKEGEAYREAVGSGWTQNMMTHEYCPQCEAEAEQAYRDSDKDIPF